METIKNFDWDKQLLEKTATDRREEYKNNDPFPHIVLDNFFPTDLVEEVLRQFPDRNNVKWQESANVYTKNKFSLQNDWKLPPFIRYFIYQLNSSLFVDFLEKITGIEGLIPDPHMLGGGLHQSEVGGKLGIHADFNYYKRLKLERRVNLLLYLNKDWEDAYGGHLELWTKDMKTCVKKAAPLFNRCVLFSTTDFAFHGHPDPLTCPPGRSRKSIALYYYSNGRPKEEIAPPHSTLYQNRPGEKPEKPSLTAKGMIYRFVPPIIFDIKNKLTEK